MADARTSYRFDADTSSLSAALRSARGDLEKTNLAAIAGGQSLGSFSRGAKLTAQQLQQVSFQLNDFAVQVASGGNPLTALIQQGSQLNGTFGGVGNAVRALGTLITPAAVGITGMAAAVAGVTVAVVQGYREQAQFERSLLLTGNRAGVTADEMRSLARAIADSTILTVGASREALQAAIASGQFGTQSIGAAATAAGLLAERTGQDVADILAQFGKLKDGVARGAAELNRSYNFLSVAQFQYIRELEAGGKVEEARAETLRLLGVQIGRNTPTELGLLESALKKTKDTWSEFWDAALNVGRPQSLSQQIEIARSQLEAAENRLSSAPALRLRPGETDVRQRGLQALRDRLQTLREQQRFEGQAAQSQAETVASNAEDIRKQERSYIDAGLALQRAGFAQRLAQADAARSIELASVERQFDLLSISQERYAQRRFELERASVAAKAAAIDKEMALESQRVVENVADSQQREARLIDLRTRRIGVEKELFEVEERRRRGEFAGAPRAVAESPQTDFRQSELAGGAAIAQMLADRRAATLQGARELLDVNRALGASLIRDDMERGNALLAIEEEQLRKRLDLAALAGEERVRAESAVADFIALRNRQLVEELKPTWQVMLDEWQNTTLGMKRFSDDFMKGFLDQGRETWVEWAASGKLTTKGLTDFIKQEFLRLVYQQYLSQSVASVGKTLLNGIVSNLPGLLGAAGGGSFAPTGGSGLTLGGVSAGGGGGGLYSLGTKLATGTNYVPYDGFKASLHEGEAVVPKKYNPAAGGAAAPAVNITQNVTVGEGVTRGEVYQAVKSANAELMQTLTRSRNRDGAFA